MTVPTTTSREQYATDGVTTAFTSDFPFFDGADVNSIFVDSGGVSTAWALSTDFTVSGGSGAGGMLTAMSAPASGGILTVFRDIPFTQEDEYVENDALPADTLEQGFDRAAMRDQQLQDGLDRALLFPPTIDPGVSAVLPTPVAGQVLGWNGGATALENKNLGDGTAVYTSTATTNAGATTTEAVTPKGLHDSVYNSVGKHLVPILAGSMQPATTNGAASGTVETATNKVLYRTLDFDSGTQEFAGFVLPWPKSSNEGTISFRGRWTAAGGTNGQGVVWALEATGNGDGDDPDTAYGTAVQVVDTKIGTNLIHVTAESAALTIKNLAEGDLVFFRVKRIPADASDNLGADARLIAVDVFLTTNTGTDA